MATRSLRRILTVTAGTWLCGVHGPASAADLCAPSEATDPQALHINGSKPFIYKSIGDTHLRLHVFTPGGRKPGTKSPAVVFFFGGGWLFGDLRRFQTQAPHPALRGAVTVLAGLRVNDLKNPHLNSSH